MVRRERNASRRFSLPASSEADLEFAEVANKIRTQEERKMKLSFFRIGLLTVSVLALLGTATAQRRIDRGERRELRADRHEIRADTIDIRTDRRDIHSDVVDRRADERE